MGEPENELILPKFLSPLRYEERNELLDDRTSDQPDVYFEEQIHNDDEDEVLGRIVRLIVHLLFIFYLT